MNFMNFQLEGLASLAEVLTKESLTRRSLDEGGMDF